MGKREDTRLLGVGPKASDEVLRAAFRNLAIKCHPDVAGEQFADEFIRLREAYERLRDNHWDEPRKGAAAQVPQPSSHTSAAPRKGDFVDLFNGLMTGLGNGSGRKVLDCIELEVPVDFLLFGEDFYINYPVVFACRRCGGRGVTVHRQGRVDRCRACDGGGEKEVVLKLAVNIAAGSRAGTSIVLPLDQFGLANRDLVLDLTLHPVA